MPEQGLASQAWDVANTSIIDKVLGFTHGTYEALADKFMKMDIPGLAKRGTPAASPTGAIQPAGAMDVAKNLPGAAAAFTLETASGMASPLNIALSALGFKSASDLKKLTAIAGDVRTSERFLSATKAAASATGVVGQVAPAAAQLAADRTAMGAAYKWLGISQMSGQAAGAGLALSGASGAVKAAQALNIAKTPDAKLAATQDLLAQLATTAGGASMAAHVGVEAGKAKLAALPETADRIDWDGMTKNSTKGTFQDVKEQFVTQWVHDLFPVRQATDILSPVKLPYLQDPEIRMRLARGMSGKAEGFINFGVRSPITGTVISPALTDILKGVPDLKEFATYLLAEHSMESEAKGRQTGVPYHVAERDADRLRPKYQAVAGRLGQFQTAMLAYAAESGTFDPKRIHTIGTFYKNYIPLDRVIDFDPGGGGQARRGVNRGQPGQFKSRLGSVRPIIDPLESIIGNTHNLVDLVEKNEAAKTLTRLADGADPALRADVISPVEAGVAPVANVNIAELKKHLVSNGVPQTAIDALNPTQLKDTWAIFRPGNIEDKVSGKNYISVLDQGDRKFYEVHNKALYDAITIHGEQPNLFARLFLTKPVQAIRKTATLGFSFIARNPVRDNITATIQTKYGFTPVIDSIKGMASLLKRDHFYQDFMDSGASQAAMVSSDRASIRTNIQEMHHGSLANTVLHPIDMLSALSESFENATRLGEFRKGMTRELAGGQTPKEAMARAALAARDVTIDFQRGGSASRTWNRYNAFFNAALQGTFRTIENAKASPMTFMVRGTSALTIPTIAMWYLNHNNEYHTKRPDYEKENYWHFPLNGWETATLEGGNKDATDFAIIPKPFPVLNEIFVKPMEGFLNYAFKRDPLAIRAYFKVDGMGLLTSAAGRTIPSAMLPMVELLTNYSFYRQRNIESPYDMNLDPSLQHTRWTSQTAMAVSKGLQAMGVNFSPIKIDHLIYSYGTTLGQEVLRGGENMLQAGGVTKVPPKPSSGLASLSGIPLLEGVGERTPFAGAFLRTGVNPQASTMTAFFADYEKLQGIKASINKTIEARDPALRRRLIADNRDLLRRGEAFNTAKEAIGLIGHRIDRVFESSLMTPKAKQEALGKLYKRMVNIAARVERDKRIPTTTATPPPEPPSIQVPPAIRPGAQAPANPQTSPTGLNAFVRDLLNATNR